jgi:hypothetical protein
MTVLSKLECLSLAVMFLSKVGSYHIEQPSGAAC